MGKQEGTQKPKETRRHLRRSTRKRAKESVIRVYSSVKELRKEGNKV